MVNGRLPGWIDKLHLDITFLVGPEWILAAIFYLITVFIQQKSTPHPQFAGKGGLL